MLFLSIFKPIVWTIWVNLLNSNYFNLNGPDIQYVHILLNDYDCPNHDWPSLKPSHNNNSFLRKVNTVWEIVNSLNVIGNIFKSLRQDSEEQVYSRWWWWLEHCQIYLSDRSETLFLRIDPLGLYSEIFGIFKYLRTSPLNCYNTIVKNTVQHWSQP